MTVIQGRLISLTQGEVVAQYSIAVRLEATIVISDSPGLKVLVSASARSAADGAFRIEIDPPGTLADQVEIIISAPNGIEVDRRQLSLSTVLRFLALEIRPTPRFTVTPSNEPSLGQRFRVNGQVIDEKGKEIPRGLPVVIFGEPFRAQGAIDPAQPLIIADTQAGGRFAGDWPTMTLNRAFARVAGGEPVAVPLDDDRLLVKKILLVVNLNSIDSGTFPEKEDCSCTDKPPRAPDPSDLTANPGSFSQDLGGGCMDLTVPNRTLEEFTYSFVVRTSEPNVKGVTLGAKRMVSPTLLSDLLGVSFAKSLLTTRSLPTLKINFAKLEMDFESAKNLVRADEPPTMAAFERAAWLSQVNSTRELIDAGLQEANGRSVMDAAHLIDWDHTPTIHLSIDVSHGHVLQYKEVWRADGYSLGDLLYSLPLAPSQRREIAIVSWDKQNLSGREEKLESEEQLDALLTRDRDIREIVGTHLHEEVDAGSRNTTWGAAGGIGAGIIGSGFGIFGGVAGGGSGSDTNAWQDSARTFSANSLQSLRDRVGQRASSVRTQRSTVIETLTQRETQRIETESVANYNRCHAITIEYFEVLHHFLITHELASVQECLFVPLPMPEFDNGKALRWREPLLRFLKDRTLGGGFAAIERIADDWVGWDFPESRYSEEAPETLEGELRISFLLPRPRDAEDGKFQVDSWRPYGPFLPAAAQEIFVAKLNDKAARERDLVYHREVAPEIAKNLVQRLRFAYVTTTGEVEISMDATLVSTYAANQPLYVSLNPSGGLPNIPREDITYLKIWFTEAELPPDAKVIVHSGRLRYRTPHYTAFLFNSQHILDDIGGGDAVVIPTPVSRSEMRDPRQDDRFRAEKLVQHLHTYLEYYHQAIWISIDAQRRFMLLDTVLLGDDDGRSIASVCTNEIIGIAGNSIILPVAPGQRLNPQVESVDAEGNPIPIINAYAVPPSPALRVSVPTRGVYAEAIAGNCNSCESIDDNRYWRWTTDGQLEIPEIGTVSTASRGSEEPNLTPAELPKPLVSIQNAPAVPSPIGLGAAFDLLSKPELFRDITGLEGTQKNAAAAFDAALSAASGLGDEAFKLARQQELGVNSQRMLDRISQAQQEGLLSAEAAQQLSMSALKGLIGETPDTESGSPTQDETVKEVLDATSQAKKADIKVSGGDETVEVTFDDEKPVVGSAAGFMPGDLDINKSTFPDLTYIDQPVIVDSPLNPNDEGLFEELAPFVLDTKDLLEMLVRDFDNSGTITDADLAELRKRNERLKTEGHVRDHPTDPNKYQIERNLHIVYPSTAGNLNVVAGNGPLPLAVLVHGNHHSWEKGITRDSYLGYIYLQEALAKQGLISVSVDTNAANYFGSLVEMRARMVIGALDALKVMHKDKDSRFHNRIDFSRVGMMGHSRGGDAVVRAAIINGTRTGPAKYGIKAVCVLAPTDLTGTITSIPARHSLSPAETEFLSVVYGSLDGDVSGLGGAGSFVGTGFRHYDRASTKNKTMVFIEHCSHNRFNQVWAADGDESSIDEDDRQLRLHKEDAHQKLAIEYIGGFFEQLLGKTTYKDFFTGKRTNSKAAQVALQWSFGTRVVPIDEMETGNPQRQLNSSFIDPFADIPVRGSGGTQTLDLQTNHQTNVMYADPNFAAATRICTIKLTGDQKDWSLFDAVIFRAGADFDLKTPDTISAGPLPSFSFISTYDDGTEETISAGTLSSTYNPLRPFFHYIHHDGQEIRDILAGAEATIISKLKPALLTGGEVNIVANPATTPPINGVHIATPATGNDFAFTVPFAVTSVPAGIGGTFTPMENCTVLFLETVHVPMNNFTGAKTKRIASISIEVPAAFPNYLFFDSFELVKF